MPATDRVTATVTRMGDTLTYVFATDDYGREYFVHKKNVSQVALKGWDWIAATIDDYVVEVEGTPVQESASKWILLEVEVR